MLKNTSIKIKLFSILGLAILVGLVSGTIITLGVKYVSTEVTNLQETVILRTHIVELENQLRYSHNQLIGFLNSGDLKALDAFNVENAKTLKMINAIDDNIKDTTLLNNLKEASNLYKHWLTNVAEKQITHLKSPYTVDLARLIESQEETKNIWNEMHDHFEIISQNLTEKVNKQSAVMLATMNRTFYSSVFGTATSIGILVLAAYLIFTVVSIPLENLTKITSALTQKNWNIDIPNDGRGDEIGLLTNSIRQFRENGIENERLMEAQKLEDQKRQERVERIEALVSTFRHDTDTVTSALADSIDQMSHSSTTMQKIANDTTQLSEQVTLTAQSAGENVQNVSGASEALTESIQEISKQLSSTNKMVSEAKTMSADTVNKMKVLETSANEINSVIEIISDIAEQTNLLALNATIEAARAGDAGKGFAVVANEVKGLASETAKATEQVQAQVNRIQSDTAEAVSYIQKISHAIEGLSSSVTNIAAAMEEQTSATQEISRNVNEASNGTKNVVNNITDVNNASQETLKTSDVVSKIATDLTMHSERLEVSINNFIEKIQTT